MSHPRNVSLLAGHGDALIVEIADARLGRRDHAILYPVSEDRLDGWCGVEWIPAAVAPLAYAPTGVPDCWAWVEDGVLYLPVARQRPNPRWRADDRPDPSADWHDPATGGASGSALAATSP
jgi:hypothetical protein